MGTQALRAFCHLVASDGLDACAILQTQLRHARNLAGYNWGRVGTARLQDQRTVLELLERQLTYGLRPVLESAQEKTGRGIWDPDPALAFADFIATRSKAERIERQALDNVRRVVRSLRQATYVHAPEYPPPGLFFGLEQAKPAERVDAMAREYQRRLLSAATGLVAESRLSKSSALTVAYEYIGSGNHSHTERAEDEIELHTQISVPVWLLYMPRYIPTLCHEVAHPVAAELLREEGGLGQALEDFIAPASEVVERWMGRGALQIVPNLVEAIAREILTDTLSTRIAGTAYAVAWHASSLGRGSIGPQLHLSLPTYVRLRLLAEVSGRSQPAPAASLHDVIEQDCHLYRQVMQRRGYTAKLEYQEALFGVCAGFLERLMEALPPVEAVPDEAWSSSVGQVLTAIEELPAYVGKGLREGLELPSSWTGDTTLSIPGLLWQLHHHAHLVHERWGATAVPEGRIFHALHTSDGTASTWKEAQYSEWLWVRRLLTGTASEFQAWWSAAAGSSARLGRIIGAYNFVAVRRDFHSRTYSDYPPVDEAHPFHSTRQILAELRPRTTEAADFGIDELFDSGLPLVHVEVTFSERSRNPLGQLATFACSLADADVHRVVPFRTIGSGDLVVVAAVRSLAAVVRLVRALNGHDEVARTSTSIVLPDGAHLSEQDEHEARASVRAFLRLPKGLSVEELGRLRAAAPNVATETVLGADDLELHFPLRSFVDLQNFLTFSDVVPSVRPLSNIDSRFGIVLKP